MYVTAVRAFWLFCFVMEDMSERLPPPTPFEWLQEILLVTLYVTRLSLTNRTDVLLKIRLGPKPITQAGGDTLYSYFVYVRCEFDKYRDVIRRKTRKTHEHKQGEIFYMAISYT